MSGPNEVRLRLPTLEIFGIKSGAALSVGAGMPLLPDEKKDARAVFKDSLNLEPIRIVTAVVANAPVTLGNIIRKKPNELMSRGVLIHELTHVWQFQTQGTAYISDSAYHQTIGTITTGDRNAAYSYSIEPGKSFYDYTAEQQAMIVQTWFEDPGKQIVPEYRRLIEELRQARPISRSLIVEEAAFGPGMGAARNLPDTGFAPTVPLLRLEW